MFLTLSRDSLSSESDPSLSMVLAAACDCTDVTNQTLPLSPPYAGWPEPSSSCCVLGVCLIETHTQNNFFAEFRTSPPRVSLYLPAETRASRGQDAAASNKNSTSPSPFATELRCVLRASLSRCRTHVKAVDGPGLVSRLWFRVLALFGLSRVS